MGRSKWVLILLLPLLFGFDTRNPFRTRGPFRTDAFTIGSGGWLAPPASGVEERVVELAGLGVDVCGEPFNGPETATSGAAAGGHDFVSSNNTYECYGRGADYWGWDPEVAWNQVSTASWPGWGAESYVLQEGGGFAFFQGKKANSMPTGEITASWRYHVQFSSGDFDKATPDCGSGTRRTKLSEAFWLEATGPPLLQSQFQFEEPQTSCPYSTTHTSAFEAGWDSGPGATSYSNVLVSPAVGVEDCDDDPCAVEMRIRGDIRAGQNINITVRVTSLETGITGEADLGTHDMPGAGTPYATDSWGGDLFHTGTGDWVFGYFVHAIWSSNVDQWIGPAYELTPE